MFHQACALRLPFPRIVTRALLYFLTWAIQLAFPVTSPSQPLSSARLTILHWNDFHAQNAPIKMVDTSRPGARQTYYAGGAATLHGYLNHLRNGREDVVLLNAGDDFQGTPISTLTSGRSQIELMNLVSPTAMTLGNHEFDYGMESLRVNMSRASFPILCSNVVNLVTGATLGLPFLIKPTGGSTVGLIGLTQPDLLHLTQPWNLRGYRMRNVDSSIDLSLRAMRASGHPDLVILISHMGLGEDTVLAVRRHDIDVIVSGHDHIALKSPLKKGRTLIVQAGSKGQYVGDLKLTIDLKGDSVLRYSGRLLETRVDSVEPDPISKRIVDSLEAIVDNRLGNVIGQLLMPWDRRQGSKVETGIGDFESDAMRSACETDIAFQNAGGMRKDLVPGPITERDIWEINPFSNTIVVFNVSGARLREMMEWQTSVAPRDFLQVSGLKYTYDSSKPTRSRLQVLEVRGEPVRDTEVYSICTNSFVSEHLKLFFNIGEASVRVYDTGRIDRDGIIGYIVNHSIVRSTVEGRIVDVAPPTAK